MTHLFLPIDLKKPVIRLVRVQETSSKKTWIFDFVDPVHKFGQSIIMSKRAEPWQMEMQYEKLWDMWTRQIRETGWRKGKA